MEATVIKDKTVELSSTAAKGAVKCVSFLLDVAAGSMSTLSSLVKGEKKVVVKLEETKTEAGAVE